MSIKMADNIVVDAIRGTESVPLQARLDALVATVAYGDLFDFALTRSEIHRYLIGVQATIDEIAALLSDPFLQPQPITVQHSFVTMRGRESLILTRKRREATASKLWQQAITFRPMLARLPFIRMVAVTGTLAMNNADANSDIDLFVVTLPGRLWLARAFIIGVVRLAALRGITLCPNYLVSQRALRVPDHNIFTAHELAQMVPILGLQTYQHMMSLNQWVMDYLPNTTVHTAWLGADSERRSLTKSIGETLFGVPAANGFERWEMRRKSERFAFQQLVRGGSEADFGPDWCKGHFDGHGQRTLRTYRERLQSLGIEGVVSFAS